jgi:hypothetical protein
MVLKSVYNCGGNFLDLPNLAGKGSDLQRPGFTTNYYGVTLIDTLTLGSAELPIRNKSAKECSTTCAGSQHLIESSCRAFRSIH